MNDMLYHRCFDDLFTGIILVDHRMNILYANQWVMDRLAGEKRQATHLIELYGNHSIRKIQQVVSDVIETRNPRVLSHAFHSWIIPLPDTRFRDGLMRQSAGVTYIDGYALIQIRDESDTVLRIDMIKRNHTRILYQKEQVEYAKKMQALGTLAGGVAHHFNNMLAVIVGNMELIQLELTGRRISGIDDVLQMLQEIQHASLRGKELVQQVLMFAQKHFRKKQIFSIATTIMEAVEMVDSSIPPNISLKFSIHTIHKSMQGDPCEIRQILYHLVNNSIEAIKDDKGIVEIVVTERHLTEIEKKSEKTNYDGHYLCLSVRDSGPGIDPAIQDRICEPFFTTKEVGDGAGMGLSVINGIVSGYGGFIRLESIVGQGTTVAIFLPTSV